MTVAELVQSLVELGEVAQNRRVYVTATDMGDGPRFAFVVRVVGIDETGDVEITTDSDKS
jgi:hypothetical protein